MKFPLAAFTLSALVATFYFALSAHAQVPDRPPGGEPVPPPFGPGGRGPGGFGMMGEETKLVKQFDGDGNGRLNAEERKAAREFLQKERADGRGQRGFGGPRGGPGGFGRGGPGGFSGRGENPPPPEPGKKLSPAEVKAFPNAPLYDPQTL